MSDPLPMDAVETADEVMEVTEAEGGDEAQPEAEAKIEKVENGSDVIAEISEAPEMTSTPSEEVGEEKAGKENVPSAQDNGETPGPDGDQVIPCNDDETPHVCKPCNLVFGDDAPLQKHQLTDYHKKVAKGQQPSTGRYYCFLCWRGYGHKLDLLEHYGGSAHEYNVRIHNVKAIWMKLTKDEVEEDDRRRKGRASDERRQQHRHHSDRSRSPARDSSRRGSRSSVRDYVSRSERAKLGKGLRHCVECNLVFVSERSETLHRESQRHRAVFEKKRPLAPSGKESPFVCYLCWWGYDEERDLHLHYDATEHVERMKRYGIERLLKDTRHQQDDDSSPPSCLDGFIILDEVGADDDEEEEKAKDGNDLQDGKTDVGQEVQQNTNTQDTVVEESIVEVAAAAGKNGVGEECAVESVSKETSAVEPQGDVEKLEEEKVCNSDEQTASLI